ncbi:DUF1289 domain-containing protein [Pseudocolwellia sp. HL-MZ19]|uniref:DUF1289 domain-containing protein n=1 Tax=unclassified Pseudocolwellia TaxID=2848178 RepID=UPI003CF65480
MGSNSNEIRISTSAIKSPCVLKCCLDKNEVCTGCFRHIKEIMDWKHLSDDGKKQVLDICSERKKEIKTVSEPHVHPARTR